jgi:hypothetical protein
LANDNLLGLALRWNWKNKPVSILSFAFDVKRLIAPGCDRIGHGPPDLHRSVPETSAVDPSKSKSGSGSILADCSDTDTDFDSDFDGHDSSV